MRSRQYVGRNRFLNKIRNPNIEIRNKPEAKQKPTPENPKTSIVARARFEVAVFGSFEFVSSFEIRIWDFYRMTLSALASTFGGIPCLILDFRFWILD
jgi:hypothetical protein